MVGGVGGWREARRLRWRLPAAKGGSSWRSTGTPHYAGACEGGSSARGSHARRRRVKRGSAGAHGFHAVEAAAAAMVRSGQGGRRQCRSRREDAVGGRARTGALGRLCTRRSGGERGWRPPLRRGCPMCRPIDARPTAPSHSHRRHRPPSPRASHFTSYAVLTGWRRPFFFNPSTRCRRHALRARNPREPAERAWIGQQTAGCVMAAQQQPRLASRRCVGTPALGQHASGACSPPLTDTVPLPDAPLVARRRPARCSCRKHWVG